MAAKTTQKSIRLSDLDKMRLECHAPWFGMRLRREDGQTYILEWQEGATSREVTLSADCAHLRLLAELCERTAQWIYYAVGASCADTYLGHSDYRIGRLAELYGQRSIPESADFKSWRTAPQASHLGQVGGVCGDLGEGEALCGSSMRWELGEVR